MSYAVIAATLPTARRLVLDLVTYYNHGRFEGTTMSGTISESASRNRSNAFPMRSLKSNGQRKSQLQSSRSQRDDRDDDADSQEMIIRKDIDVEIRFDESSGSASAQYAPAFPPER
jgi:hypothetical protein